MSAPKHANFHYENTDGAAKKFFQGSTGNGLPYSSSNRQGDDYRNIHDIDEIQGNNKHYYVYVTLIVEY